MLDKNISYCRGCRQCFHGGGCSQNDDMLEISQKMLDADVIVFASPIYFYGVAGQLKTLIDRCCPYYTSMKNKETYLIVSSADDDPSALRRAVESLRGFTVCLEGSEEKGVIYGVGAWNMGDILNTPAMEEAYIMGKRA